WSTASMGIFTRVPKNSRSYTGHEPITLGGDNRIIHMNGRIYDADTGRFMQADPVVQAPANLQNYNRYSYVLNNPMSYTDPSGYLFKKLGKFIKKNWRTIAAIGAAYVTFGLSTGAWTFKAMADLSAAALIGGGAAAGAVNGAISTGTLKGALTGAASGAIFGALGGAGLGGFEAFAASGLVGGVMSVIQGGKFGHGFVSAGVGSVTGGMFGKGPMNRIIGSAIVGGTVSAITGGKFANGAFSAAFATALKADWGASKQQKTGSITYGAVTTDKIKGIIKGAVENGHNLTKKALDALNSVAAGDEESVQRFERFFGEVSDSKIRIVRRAYQSIDQAFENGVTVSFDLADDSYAYVYAGGEVEVHLGKYFMGASSTGFNSKGGVFIHELGHEVSGLNDVVYGVAGAEALAKDNYLKALRNADSYEYYAESL
ncbi:M35 family metallo-endopeptidase, partial [Pseudoalteromonas rubra]|uniref:M35 family metallo-endopeptidase n=1 Tax=Pseudoalteromonas rubra TaxID=43658 RepID=UPI00201698FD